MFTRRSPVLVVVESGDVEIGEVSCLLFWTVGNCSTRTGRVAPLIWENNPVRPMGGISFESEQASEIATENVCFVRFTQIRGFEVPQ